MTEQATWVPVGRTSVDQSGRFYLPRDTVEHIFGDAKAREVQVYIGPNKTICLIPIKREETK